MRGAVTAACALMALAVSVVEVHAREWRVRLDGTGDFTNIRDAASYAASDGDTVLWFAPATTRQSGL
ncbi:MAG: hypothetical protein IPK72_22320 [Candidatus Eisenbacteria bacterium]|nr:hypothetical protein [Candidatus Eisenbacteria bacterium]